jgi:hypothetical protein
VGSKRRQDERSIRRPGPKRDPKKRFLVVCEGSLTEPAYFKAFQHEVRNRLVHVEIAREHGVPKTVVESADRLCNEAKEESRRQHDDNLLYDEVWGVFDIDSHPNIECARELAEAKSIRLAISNPCFELWAVLHFQDQRSEIQRKPLRRALQKLMPDYDKELDFAKMHPGYETAVKRAEDLDREAANHQEPGRNPTTGVARLTEAIRLG